MRRLPVEAWKRSRIRSCRGNDLAIEQFDDFVPPLPLASDETDVRRLPKRLSMDGKK